jgi:hypothetical protein
MGWMLLEEALVLGMAVQMGLYWALRVPGHLVLVEEVQVLDRRWVLVVGWDYRLEVEDCSHWNRRMTMDFLMMEVVDSSRTTSFRVPGVVIQPQMACTSMERQRFSYITTPEISEIFIDP